MKLILDYKLISVLAALLLIIGGITFLGIYFLTLNRQFYFGSSVQDKINALPINEKLKVSPERIVYSSIIDDIKCDAEKNCVNNGKVVTYVYPKSEKMAKRTYTGELTVADEKGKTKKIKVDKLEESERDYNYIRFKYGDTSLSEFYPGVQFVREKATGDWYELENQATTTVEAFDLQMQGTSTVVSRIKDFVFPKVLAYDTFYPGSVATDNPVDGNIYNYEGTTGTTWSNLRTTLRGTNGVDLTSGSISVVYISTDSSGNYKEMDRSIFTFDTSSISDTDIVSSSTFFLAMLTSTSCGGLTPELSASITDGWSDSNTTLTGKDFILNNKATSTRWSDTNLACAAADTTGYKGWPFNATGIANISLAGMTKIAVRSDADVDNSAPTGNSKTTSIAAYQSNNTGTASDPMLWVEHAAAAGGAARRVVSPIINFE